MKEIEKILSQFPEVKWDRFVREKTYFLAYGWIDREDSYKDFMMLEFRGSVPQNFMTSSKKYSEEFHRRLGFANPHNPCLRVEDMFPDLNNVIKL